MHTKYFLGLTFYPQSGFSRNIESFRARFDTKYHSNQILHLALVPSFEVAHQDKIKLNQELIEELESFFFENTQHQTLSFTGIDVHEYKKNKIIYLNPSFSEELLLCQESLFSICQSYNADPVNKLKNQKTFLTLGRYQDPVSLHEGIELASREFSEISPLALESICLFSKQGGVWQREVSLISFERPGIIL